jgi:predicted nucleotidyltransferase
MADRPNLDNGYGPVAEPNTILRCTVGSTVHGVAVASMDDRDEMGICLEPPEYVIGLRGFEQWVFRTKPEGVRSGPGDLDLTVYSARKWSRLALGGNPTVLLPLFVDESECQVLTPAGRTLRDNAESFLSQKCTRAFLGYLTQQRERLTGVRGSKNVNRPELVERFGFDTKYAMHALRLGFQGIEISTEARLSLPMKPEHRSYLLDVRQGREPFENVVQRVHELEAELEVLLERGNALPKEPDANTVNSLLQNLYRDHWGWS